MYTLEDHLREIKGNWTWGIDEQGRANVCKDYSIQFKVPSIILADCIVKLLNTAQRLAQPIRKRVENIDDPGSPRDRQ